MRYRNVLFVLAGLFGCSAEGAPLELDRFVGGWPIEVEGSPQFFDLPLNIDVYAVSSDVTQLAVLDALSEPQSFVVRTSEVTPTERRETLDASALFADRSNGTVANVTTNERRTAITVTESRGVTPGVVGFVVDARSTDLVPAALELDWRELPQPFLLNVRIEHSVDLTRWRDVGAGAVATLAVGALRVRQAHVSVAGDVGGYYRITPVRPMPDWYLLRATLIASTVEAVPTRNVILEPLDVEVSPDQSGVLLFDAGAVLPVVAVNLDYGPGAGWAEAEIATSSTLEGPWRSVVATQLFYGLDLEGQRFESPAQPVSRSAARYWKVQSTAPLRGVRPRLRLDYSQQYLRVSASGIAPYLLAAGTLAPGAGPDAAFASVLRQLQPAEQLIPLAALGLYRELGGSDALVPAREVPIRLTLLWGVLVAGVLLVVAMAVRLAREMKAQSTR